MFKDNGRLKKEVSYATIEKEYAKKKFVCGECGRSVNIKAHEFGEKVMCDNCNVPMEEII